MSRAFLKDDADLEGVIVPRRAPLPEGVPNLVTPSGLARLEREHAELAAERDALLADPSAPDRARRLAAREAALDELEGRLASARPVPPPETPDAPVGLGATVTVRFEDDGEELSFRIVGVDEADPLEGRVAFTAPIAVAVLERRVGEVVEVDMAGRRRRGAIASCHYRG
jgi:transcription elongation factor GreB